MIPVLTADEMREADRLTIEEVGLPGPVLMENAGRAVADAIQKRFSGARRVVVVCGKGNNGGDGFVVTRRLRERGAEALLLGRRDDVRSDARTHLEACERSGGRVVEVPDAQAWEIERRRLDGADVLVDALLGTGLRDRASGLPATVIADLVRQVQAGIPVVAVDIPSGVRADGGTGEGPAVQASLTVTFAAPKPGLVVPPDSDRCGELLVADIGISPETLAAVGPSLFLLEESDAAAAYPPRDPGAHKGRFGHVLVVAGSVGKTGAAVLAALGALRAGAGLVTVATPVSCLGTVAGGRPEVMTEPLPETPTGGISEEALDRVLSLAGERDAVVLGPGLGPDPSTQTLARELVRRCPAPLLVDADGLNALAAAPARERTEVLRSRGASTVLTPHPGEMSRLTGEPVSEIQAHRPQAARDLARQTETVVVLKGQRTVVAEPGGRAALNPTGNPGMGTGGTGDVLSGVVGALLARHQAWLAATAGVFVHGRAGDRVAEARGEEGLLAGDLAEGLPEVLASLVRRGGSSSRR